MSGKDRRLRRDTLTLYVPAHRRTGIHPGSAVVGSAWSDRSEVDVEGDIYGAGMDFETRLAIAAGRHRDRAPTRARYCLASDDVIAVGTVRRDPVLAAWVIETLDDPDTLAAWIAPEPVPAIGGSGDLHNRAAGLWTHRLTSDRLHSLASAGKLNVPGVIAAAREQCREARTGNSNDAGNAIRRRRE